MEQDLILWRVSAGASVHLTAHVYRLKQFMFLDRIRWFTHWTLFQKWLVCVCRAAWRGKRQRSPFILQHLYTGIRGPATFSWSTAGTFCFYSSVNFADRFQENKPATVLGTEHNWSREAGRTPLQLLLEAPKCNSNYCNRWQSKQAACDLHKVVFFPALRVKW